MNQIAARPQQQTMTASATGQSDQQRAIAEVQAAMMIARMNPRDVMAARDRILLACTRPKLAEASMYSYARGGQDITGPSIRLAEAMAQGWGNMSFGVRELEQRNGESVMQAFAWDIESNTRREMTFTVRHWRDTKSGGYAITDARDVYELTANMGARRLRTCILGVIPRDIQEEAVEQCQATLEAKFEVTPELVTKVLGQLEKHGVDKHAVEQRIQRKAESMTPALVVSLHKILTSMKDGMSKPSDWFEMDTRSDAAKKLDHAAKTAPKATAKESEQADDAVVHRPVHVADAETGEIVPQDEPLTLSFAQVEDMINSATDTNALDLAVDSIDAAPEKFHGELRNLAKKKAAEIEAGIK